MKNDIIAEWTGEAPARSHKPFDTGSIPVSAIGKASRMCAIFAYTVGFLFAHRVRNGRNVYATGQDRGLCNSSGLSIRPKIPNTGHKRVSLKNPSSDLTGQTSEYRTPVAMLGTILPHTDTVGKSEIAAYRSNNRLSTRKLGCKIPKILLELTGVCSLTNLYPQWLRLSYRAYSSCYKCVQLCR